MGPMFATSPTAVRGARVSLLPLPLPTFSLATVRRYPAPRGESGDRGVCAYEKEREMAPPLAATPS